MGRIPHNAHRFGETLAMAATFVVLGCVLVSAADHPRLVSLDSTSCSTCHGKLLRGATVIHPAVEDDCTACHALSIEEEGTTVNLILPEPDLCAMCHDRLEAAAYGELEAPHAPVADSCLTCHTPHAGEHEALLKVPRTETCATCHDTADLAEIHHGQITGMVDCTSCHLPHGGANAKLLIGSHRHAPFADGACDSCHRAPFAGRIRLRVRGEKICIACHGDFRNAAGEHGSVHAALAGTRTRAGCLSCHDPHMSPNAALLTARGPELCGECHTDVLAGATADTGHAPAAEDCANCHLPHASEQSNLLIATSPALCLTCHDADEEDLGTAHLGAAMDGLDCTGCHSPHGDGNEKLLARNVHAAIEEGCDTCHEGAFNKLVANGESELCLACHDDIGEAATAAAVPHGAMSMIRCVECHNPHASAQTRLVKAPAGGVCTTCHDDQAAGPDEVAHSVITLLGCRACHEPHGGANAKLLRVTGSELCLGCHDSARVKIPADGSTVTWLEGFEVTAATAAGAATLTLSADGEHGHPMRDHRVLGAPTEEERGRIDVDFAGALTCLSCHDPHKGRSRHLFAGGAGSPFELCGACHEK